MMYCVFSGVKQPQANQHPDMACCNVSTALHHANR